MNMQDTVVQDFRRMSIDLFTTELIEIRKAGASAGAPAFV
ncbi:hypothetical protein DYBT9275_02999 [Dyadobacter sp. CECT 9275]|uniref:Uncharacterized protein n=1 Tax=Dyadobacter helix TaxID=2822344 RepID=A0A916JD57_9BACT|nr:hypothetical protein DYBT9275_02999 [Dyadobacter sp. CECT 9275]